MYNYEKHFSYRPFLVFLRISVNKMKKIFKVICFNFELTKVFNLNLSASFGWY
ncbi:MAG: hypothetical protein ACI9KF_000077 [Arenicella sp.]|jgi:hypothetical protein